MKNGPLTRCAKQALTRSTPVLIKNPLSSCGDCPLAQNYRGRGGMTLRLEHDGKVYGLLTVSIPIELIPYPEEQELLEDVAGDMDIAPKPTWVYCRGCRIRYKGKDAILVNAMDITRFKELEHLLGIQDKMASLGHVAAGIAHEIRNPLSGINIYLNTLERIYDRADSLDMVGEILEKLQSASGRIESVIKRVMDFSKPSAPNLVWKDLNEPIEEAVSLSSVTLRKRGIQLESALAQDLPPCLVDRQLIEEAVLNLIINAAEAMKNASGDKKINITSSLENDSVIVMVSDSGPGVPMQFKEAIFDPFYTTKEDSTGIGLSIARRIITDHGGSLECTESQWGGAQFTVILPLNSGADSK
ncbi:MAG: GHKL domain-containing protein [Deltaproteobacteria bacterium]|nr:GHKL domain-containing protein [Deltaproteobacteria bacterium]